MKNQPSCRRLVAGACMLASSLAYAATVVEVDNHLAELEVSGETELTGAGGVMLDSLEIPSAARLVLDPIATPVFVTNGVPVFGEGARIALSGDYAGVALGRVVLMTYSRAATIPAGLFDASSVSGDATLSQTTAPDGASMQLVLTVGDYDRDAKEIRIAPIGDSITHGYRKNVKSTGVPQYAQYRTGIAARLAAKLVELSGLGGKVFFCNSGAEANEAAIKLARKWGSANGGRYEVVTMRQGFHGRTLATVAATGQAWCQEGYDPLPAGFAYADYNDLESVKAAVTDKTVAIMLEAVQGEGGVTPATPEFIEGVRALCDERNLLMICDEVQSGMGRTGTWFAWQGYNVKPDLFTLAKSIADGIPMGALVSNAKLADVFTPGSHASTFGGNPVAAAAALAVISIIEEDGLLKRATDVGALFREALQGFVDKYDKLLEVRGKGLMLGLVVDGDPKEVVDALRDQGLLALTAGGGVVRFLPPLTLKEDDLEEATDMISDALDCVFGE